MTRAKPTPFPRWRYYPPNDRPPQWVHKVVEVVQAVRPDIDTAGGVEGVDSDEALAHLRPGLEELGYQVESGKHAKEKIRRPVLFGSEGEWRVEYEVDAAHDELGVVVEVEAGRGALGNAVYRDLIRASLIVDADYLALGVMSVYRYKVKGKAMKLDSYAAAERQLDAIYASGRLQLPFKELLLFGY